MDSKKKQAYNNSNKTQNTTPLHTHSLRRKDGINVLCLFSQNVYLRTQYVRRGREGLGVGLGESGRPTRLGNPKGAEIPKENGRPALRHRPHARGLCKDAPRRSLRRAQVPGREDTGLISKKTRDNKATPAA